MPPDHTPQLFSTMSAHCNLDIPQTLQSQHQDLFFSHFHIIFLPNIGNRYNYPPSGLSQNFKSYSQFLLSLLLSSYESPTNRHLIMTKFCHSIINIPETRLFSTPLILIRQKYCNSLQYISLVPQELFTM